MTSPLGWSGPHRNTARRHRDHPRRSNSNRGRRQADRWLPGNACCVDTQAFRPCAGFLGVRPSGGVLRPEVVEYLRSATDRLREDALSYGADTAEVDRAIAALKPPQHGIYDAAVDLGDRTVTITHPGSGHTTADLVVVAPATGHADGPTVVFTGDLVEESADPDIDADSDLAAWPATLDRVLAIGGPDASYVPGHGKVVDAQFVRRQRAWLRTRASRQPRETPATLPCKR